LAFHLHINADADPVPDLAYLFDANADPGYQNDADTQHCFGLF